MNAGGKFIAPPANHTKKSMRKKKSEKNRVDNSPFFERAKPNNDAEMLRKRGHRSPDISKMPYRHTQGKTIRFFATEEKYRNFMKKQIV